MKRMLTFAKRNATEMLRDPLTLLFGLGFPLVLLLLLTVIQSNVPVELFVLESLTPGICVFGLSFMTLFGATIISRDRSSSLFKRLYTTPMTAWDFIFGYTLPLLVISFGQSVVCYVAAICLGLEFSLNILWAILILLPAYLLFISLGLLFGSFLNDKQVGGICGALLTNLTGWLSGVWFDLELVGGVFLQIAELLPFVHAVKMGCAALAGDPTQALVHLPWVLGYAVVVTVCAVAVFLSQMKKQ